MQTMYGQKPGGVSQQMRRVASFAILLFSLAGLIVGFAVGAFTHSAKNTGQSTGNSGNNPQIASQTTKIATATAAPKPVNLGWPVIKHFPGDQVMADNTTTYTITIQVVDQSIDTAHGKPINVAGITCKIWLVKETDGDKINQSINSQNDRLRAVDTLNQPLPGDVNALNFTSGTSPVQPTNGQGRVTWTYTFASSIDPGKYTLIVLADWSGVHWNWAFFTIKVMHNG